MEAGPLSDPIRREFVYWLEDGLARGVESWRRREDAERASGLTL